jgi:peptidoglycan/xylan/chitin deacetylase (PgdA/CDA1 family)
MRKKEVLARALDVLLPGRIFFPFKYRVYDGLLVLAYHRVLDIIDPIQFCYDMDLVSASTSEFDYQMSYISQYMHPVSEDEVIAAIRGEKSLPKRAVLVTFDDGFDDNYFNAFPILKKYSVPATMFISTHYIDGNSPIWFDWLASLFMASSANVVRVPDLGIKYERSDRLLNHRHFHDLIVRLRAMGNDKRLSILAYLEAEYSDAMREIDTRQSRFMTWSQVSEMSKSIVSIGSHTVSHPILSRLDDHNIEYEIIESRRIIESRIQKNVKSMSYPTGMESSFTDKVVDIVRKAGYEIAFTYQHGENRMPINDAFRLKRLHVEHHIKASYFKSMMKLPLIFRD